MTRQTALTEAMLADYLRCHGVLRPGEAVVTGAAGDGNINWVRRVRTIDGARSWIIKQARPALERFPQYQAPTERIVFENRYYRTTRHLPGGEVCPDIIAFDESQRVLILADLGDVPRLDHALAQGQDCREVFRALSTFLGAVHAATRDPALAAEFPNDGMRRLHGDHIFALPFHANEFPLAPAVRARAEEIQRDSEIVAIAAATYRRYLEPRGALLHGDVQAGNVLLAAHGPKLLDAEIAHVGDPAFDVGTMLAHLVLPAAAVGHVLRVIPAARAAWDAYMRAYDGSDHAHFRDVARYAGIELMRRTIGAARVSVVEEPAPALAVIDSACRLMRSPPDAPEDLKRLAT
ncbi:MAG: phosphotransferase [Candidatus Binatia bacterium]